MEPTPVRSHTPLEGNWVERPVEITVEGQAVTGIARANWGAVEVAVTSPILGPSLGCDNRGWSFALACHHRPEYRYALAGEVTPRGVRLAEQMLAKLYRDWLAVSRHGELVDEACRRTRGELADLAGEFDGRLVPLAQERSALRRRFKRGESTQQQYQASLKELTRERERIEQQRWEAEGAVLGRFAAEMEERCGRKLALATAEMLLTEVAVVVRGDTRL